MGNINALGAEEVETIQAVETFSATLSIVACIFMSYRIWKERSTNIANRMLSFLFFVNFVLALLYAVGRGGISNHGFCQFQGFMIQWFSVVAIFWVVLMSYQMRRWVVRKKSTKKVEHALKYYIVAIFASSAILAFVLLGLGVYGPSYLWCWIMPQYAEYRVFAFDVLLIAAWAIIVYILWEVSVSLKARMQASSLEAKIGELFTSNISIQRKMVMYVTLFIFLWSSCLFNRLLEMGIHRVWYPAALLQAFLLPLQGFFNAICYGGYLDNISLPWVAKVDNKFRNNLQNNQEDTEEINVPSVKYENDKLVPLFSTETDLDFIKGFQSKVYSIFVTTLNMGEAPAPSIQSNLKDWILIGHDVYAIGLQECVDLVGIREIILNHLGGSSKYAMYTTEIGSGNTSLGFHGFIALTLYVKQSEINAGNIHLTKPASEMMATGTDLIITTAQNKGAVGLPLQIHDTNIGFVTCHLPSDSKGKSKLSKRNASAHSILKEVTLAQEDLGFDLHLQHDHLLVFGDLNYRMTTKEAGSGVNSLTGVAMASLIEKEALDNDYNWLSRQYNLLRHKTDPFYPTIEEIKRLKEAKLNAKGAWNSVLRADELRSIMDDGDAFAGFDEPMPCFAPSYKRKKGTQGGDCGDYTDIGKIIEGYSNIGDILIDIAQAQRRASQLSNNNNNNNNTSSKRPHSNSMDNNNNNNSNSNSPHNSKNFTSADAAGHLITPPDNRHSNTPQSNESRKKSITSSPKASSSSKNHFNDVNDSINSEANNDNDNDNDDSNKEESASDTRADGFKKKAARKLSQAIANPDVPDSDDEEERESSIIQQQQQQHDDDDDYSERGSSFVNNHAPFDDRTSSMASGGISGSGRVRRRQGQAKIVTTLKEDKMEIQKIDPKKLRPPSYTDRILLHSLLDRKHRITVQSYDLCDQLRISDHRAVSMTLLLEVNQNVGYKIPNHIKVHEEICNKDPKFELYELIITNLVVKIGSIEDIDENDDDDDSDDDISVSTIDSEQQQQQQSGGSSGRRSSNKVNKKSSVTAASASNITAQQPQQQQKTSTSSHHIEYEMSTITTTSTTTATTSINRSKSHSGDSNDKTSPTHRNHSTGSTDNSNNNNNNNSPKELKSAFATKDDKSSPKQKKSARFQPVTEEMIILEKHETNSTIDTEVSTITHNHVNVTVINNNSESSHIDDHTTTTSTHQSTHVHNETTVTTSTTNTTATVAAEKPRGSGRKGSMFFPSFGSSSNKDNNKDDSPRSSPKPTATTAGGGGTIEESPRTGSRKKSLFSLGKRQSNYVNEEKAIIKDLAVESMSWKNELHQPGEWRKRVLEEEKLRKEQKQGTLKAKLKKVKKKKSDDKTIHQVVIVFPLPSKDPLLSHRKMYDFSQAFNLQGGSNSSSGNNNNKDDINNSNDDIEQPSNSLDYEVKTTSKSSTSAADLGYTDDQTTISREELLKPMSIFQWPNARNSSENTTESNSSRRRTQSNAALTNKQYKVKGCASPELGAHALIKFQNKLGYDLGSCVISLSKLINTDVNNIYTTEFTNLQVSSGGQYRGELSGKFALRYIPSPLSSNNNSHNNTK